VILHRRKRSVRNALAFDQPKKKQVEAKAKAKAKETDSLSEVQSRREKKRRPVLLLRLAS
jgi:hypothetical protein